MASRLMASRLIVECSHIFIFSSQCRKGNYAAVNYRYGVAIQSSRQAVASTDQPCWLSC